MRNNLALFALSVVMILVLPASAPMAILAFTGLGIISGFKVIRKAVFGSVDAVRNLTNANRNTENRRKGIIDRLTDAIKERSRVNLERKTYAGKYCDVRSGQWNMNGLPLDMHLDLNDGRINGSALFRVDGCNRTIETRRSHNSGGIEFGIGMDNSADALRAKDIITSLQLGHLVSVVRDDESGGYRVFTEDADAMSAVAKKLFPPVVFDIERETVSVNQYRVSAPTFEEAQRLVREAREGGHPFRPDNTYITTVDTVDGRRVDRGVDGYRLDSDRLGEFIVNESVKSVSDCKLSLDSLREKNLDDEDYLRRVSDSFYCGKVIRNMEKSVDEPFYSDGLEGRSSGNFMSLKNGREIELCRHGSVEPKDVYAVIRCSSYDEFKAYASGERKMEGHSVLFNDSVPSPKDGEYIISVPVDADLFAKAGYMGRDIDDLMDRYGSHISREDAGASLLKDQLGRDGCATVRMCGEFDFSNASVNGLPANNLLDREESVTSPSLRGEAERRQWLDDAAKIQTVDMRIDTKTQELVVDSTISIPNGYMQKQERLKLSDKEIYELSGRSGSITDADMKDVVIRLYPDLFDSYKNRDGEPKYAPNSLETFIKGTTPMTVPAYNRRMASKNTAGVANNQQQNASQGQSQTQQKQQQTAVKKPKPRKGSGLKM